MSGESDRAGPARAARATTLGVLVGRRRASRSRLVSVAFWPSLEGTSALTDITKSSQSLMEAFGVQDLATAAGYLDGQMYALMLPLLLSGLAIAATSALTAGDEDAGRLELVHALPVSRTAVWLARMGAAAIVLAAVTVLTAVVVALSLGPFSLEDVSVSRIVVATLACGALGLFHGSVAYAGAGAGGSARRRPVWRSRCSSSATWRATCSRCRTRSRAPQAVALVLGDRHPARDRRHLGHVDGAPARGHRACSSSSERCW